MSELERTHIVAQPATWYEDETLVSGWAYLSDAMPKGHAQNFAKHFPESKVFGINEPLPKAIRRPNLRPCPFCGSSDVLPRNDTKGAWWVECLDWECSSRQFFPQKMTEAEIFRILAQTWNKRSGED